MKVPLIGEIKAALRIFSKKKKREKKKKKKLFWEDIIDLFLESHIKNSFHKKKKKKKKKRDLSRLFLERFYFSIKKKKRGVDKKIIC